MSSWGTPTTGAHHRAAVSGLVETRMTTLAWINASLLLCGLWAGLRLGGTGSRYGGCLPPTWWASYASLLLSQAAQSLAAFAYNGVIYSLYQVCQLLSCLSGICEYP